MRRLRTSLAAATTALALLAAAGGWLTVPAQAGISASAID